MKRLLLNLPIKHKLMALTVAISGVALLLAGAAFAIYEQAAFRRTLARDFAILANMFDDNVAAGLAFNDPAAIEQTLQTLGANRRIVAACVYDRQGAVIGTYRRPGVLAGGGFKLPAVQPTGQRWSPERLDTFKDIELAGEVIGVVYIGTDLSELRERAWRYAAIVGFLLVGCSLVALLLAARLQRIISQPIVDLAQTVASVTAGKNYAARAHKESEDELGRLIDGFNEMLAQIQARDSALGAARDTLEKRVADRTAELANSLALLKHAQEAASHEQTRFKFIFESVPVGISLVAVTDAKLHLVNPAHERITGVSAAESSVPGVFARASHPDDYRRQMELAQPFVRGEVDHYSAEKRYLHSDGRVVWTLLTSRRFTDLSTGWQQSVTTLVDITELKDAEEKLALLHRQLMETSRHAGMAEVATGVLHNVGNVLNSVNVSATLVSDHVRHTKAVNIAKLATLFEEHKADLAGFLTNDPRGQMIPRYLGTLGESLLAEHKLMLEELEHLRKNIEHIKDIVAMQQSYASTSGVIETMSVPDMVEDALRINAGSLARHAVDLLRDYQARPVVTTDKHKVMQILINLVRNAKYACDESGRTDKQITVRITSDGQEVHIAVADNGVGIPVENLTRIFNHGFTTRKTGHGFGLHSGALAAKELGGSLTVQSAGPGHGAVFTLVLPFKRGKSP